MKPVLRYLRIALSASCLIACVLLCVVWVRSQSRIYRITWHYDNAGALQVGSCSGIVEFRTFKDLPIPVPRSANHTGRELMTKWFESIQLLGGKLHWWFEARSRVARLYVGIPHWFVILICCGLGTMPWLRWRFTLRTLLIAMTLVAVVRGWWCGKYVDENIAPISANHLLRYMPNRVRAADRVVGAKLLAFRYPARAGLRMGGFTLASFHGRLYLATFSQPSNNANSAWGFASFAAPLQVHAPTNTTVGFGCEMKDGFLVCVPHWFVILISVASGVFMFHSSWRFSLRTLLIATTLVAVGLGLIVWAAH